VKNKLQVVDKKVITKRIDSFLKGKGNNKGRIPGERYSSFDYCYNYFYAFYKSKNIRAIASKQNLYMSSLQIGFYLASWGMFRNSFLLEKAYPFYKELVKVISKSDPKLWEIDANNYNDGNNIKILLECKNIIKTALGENNNPSDTLISKIMLGVYGNTPAFDQYFKKSIHVGGFNKTSLRKVQAFYEENKSVIDKYKIRTIDYKTSKSTNIYYTKAKIIDMYGFSDGKET